MAEENVNEIIYCRLMNITNNGSNADYVQTCKLVKIMHSFKSAKKSLSFSLTHTHTQSHTHKC